MTVSPVLSFLRGASASRRDGHGGSTNPWALLACVICTRAAWWFISSSRWLGALGWRALALRTHLAVGVPLSWSLHLVHRQVPETLKGYFHFLGSPGCPIDFDGPGLFESRLLIPTRRRSWRPT